MNPQQSHTLPEEWEMKRLSEITDPKRPVSYGIVQTGESVENGVKCIRVVDLVDGKIDVTQLITTSPAISNQYKRTITKIGDIIFALRGKIGDSAIIRPKQEGINLTRGVALIASGMGVDSAYLKQQISSPLMKSVFIQSAGGSALQEIAINVLRKIKIPLPPLPEQRRIAAVLGTWDQAIEQTTDLLKQLRTRHRGLMQRLLTGKVRLPGFGGEWKHVELGDLFERVNRRNNEGNTNVLTISAQQGLVSQGRYFNKNIASEVVTNYYLLHRGEFAYNKSYSAGYPMGVLKRLEQYEKGIVSPLYICFRLRNEAENNASFFVHFFEAGCLNQNISEIAQEGARNHGLLNVGVGDFFGVRLVVPTLPDEQRAIAQILDASLREVRQQEAKLDALREQKRGLMQCLLTGQVRVPDEMLVP